jgi:hypothetical protein
MKRVSAEIRHMKKYPDVSELFALKEARRKAIAQLPVEQKVEISNRLRSIAQNAQRAPTNRTSGGDLCSQGREEKKD